MRRFFRKRLPAFLLTLVMVMTMVPAVSARSSVDLEYKVEAGETVSFDLSKFTDYYEENKDDAGSLPRHGQTTGRISLQHTSILYLSLFPNLS